VDLEKPSKADLLADAKRQFRWEHFVPSALWTALVITAISRLESPEIVGQARLIWFFVPIPAMVWAFWAWGSAERAQDEMARVLNGRAATVAVRCMLFFAFFLALVDAAFGMPITVPGPFGLPDEPFGWFEAAFVCLFIVVGTGVREQMKVFPKK
jgi:hypothetical protein